jgi:hypothetical protein
MHGSTWDTVAKVRRGLAASLVTMDEAMVRVHLPATVILQALPMVHILRIQLNVMTTMTTLETSFARGQSKLLSACIIAVLLFCCGGATVENLNEDLVASKEDGLRLYHRARKGQLGVSAERKLCAMYRLTCTPRYLCVILL